MVNIKQNLVSSSKYSLKCPYTMTPQYITIHNTANDASAANEVSYMIGNSSSTSFHYAVDNIEIVQGIPESRNAWHAGDGNGDGNRKSISIEICYSKSGGSKFTAAEQNAAEFTAYLLKQRGWDTSKVKTHQHWSGKYCPHRTLDLGWQRFLNMVASYLNGSGSSSGNGSNENNSGNTGDNSGNNSGNTTGNTISPTLVTITADTLNVRKGPAASYSVVTTVNKGEVYTIVATSNGWGQLKSGAGWISLDYTNYSTASLSSGLPYLVKVTADTLNIRSGAGTSYGIVGTVGKGEVYTIIEESGGFGKLKSGAGWISLDYAAKQS